MIKNLQKITSATFYTELPWWGKFSFSFIYGDMIVLIPLLLIILFIGLFSLSYMILALGSFITIRGLGEMMYWLLQQFGNKTYRPYDFGFARIDNNAVYILYQTFALGWTVVGCVLIVIAYARID